MFLFIFSYVYKTADAQRGQRYEIFFATQNIFLQLIIEYLQVKCALLIVEPNALANRRILDGFCTE